MTDNCPTCQLVDCYCGVGGAAVTDNRDLHHRARLRYELATDCEAMRLIADLDEALRATEAVARRLVDGWAYNTLDLEPEDGGCTWYRGTTYEGYEAAEEEAMTENERAALRSIVEGQP